MAHLLASSNGLPLVIPFQMVFITISVHPRRVNVRVSGGAQIDFLTVFMRAKITH